VRARRLHERADHEQLGADVDRRRVCRVRQRRDGLHREPRLPISRHGLRVSAQRSDVQLSAGLVRVDRRLRVGLGVGLRLGDGGCACSDGGVCVAQSGQAITCVTPSPGGGDPCTRLAPLVCQDSTTIAGLYGDALH
jgi:hypothetical protein